MSALEVARVTGVHGLRGAVRVELYWAGSESLSAGAEVELTLPSGERRAHVLRSVHRAGKQLLVELAGVDDRNAAELLRGARLSIAREALPPLAPGETYLRDLVGFEVHAPDGLVGEVVEVRVHPSVDSVVIRCPDGRAVEQPLAPTFVAAIEVGARRIELSSRDGIIE